MLRTGIKAYREVEGKQTEVQVDIEEDFSAFWQEIKQGIKETGAFESGNIKFFADGSLTPAYGLNTGKLDLFYGAGGAENKAEIMMRHAFFKLDWPQERFSIIAGQTSDVISPLLPDTINYSVAWWSGNIGYRRPQIRITKDYKQNRYLNLQESHGSPPNPCFVYPDCLIPSQVGMEHFQSA